MGTAFIMAAIMAPNTTSVWRFDARLLVLIRLGRKNGNGTGPGLTGENPGLTHLKLINKISEKLIHK